MLSSSEDPRVAERLSWYYAVTQNARPAKFLVCKRIPCEVDLAAADDASLSVEHTTRAGELQSVLERVRTGVLRLDDLPEYHPNLLDLKHELVRRNLRACSLCEWRCRVNRWEGTRRGACRMDATTRVATWFHHFGEEPPLVGSGGSGIIFFAGCMFRCVFCQNWDISQDPTNGVAVDGRKLALIMKHLRQAGALNINFVGGEPTPNLHTILDGMRQLTVNVPMLWNSDMYLTEEAMHVLRDLIDIWLPDFKYGNDRCALRLSKVIRYFATVARNHQVAQEHGDMIIRHLVLPNHLDCCTKPVLHWIAEHCPRALVNVMQQYHPDYRVPQEPDKYRDIARRLDTHEVETAYAYANALGLVYAPVS
jgi:putative pyruvate formate lyase activating enzyme